MVNAAYAVNAYTQTKVTTAYNPVDLIIMLYDGATDFLEKAATAIKMKEVVVKIKYIDKTMAIIEELLKALNFEVGGEIALNLQNLYLHMMRELVLANAKNDINKINHVISLLRNLREAWVQIRNQV
ncbi:flagellar protein FliS [Dissulfurispira thermophila]|uniref:Flagellar secretion chaperone FliS n=2 Tax=root TaxID=1 RepID=A0A7G1H1J7_9BACT|nr:flagellar export chaperone FliS [Dissulfurispira thermophila]BCB96089.1 flagellar protein FliS [Dissulfurispira thermophila]